MKYRVVFSIPYLYEVEAKDEEQAEIEAWKLFQSEQKPDFFEPDVTITPLETA